MALRKIFYKFTLDNLNHEGFNREKGAFWFSAKIAQSSLTRSSKKSQEAHVISRCETSKATKKTCWKIISFQKTKFHVRTEKVNLIWPGSFGILLNIITVVLFWVYENDWNASGTFFATYNITYGTNLFTPLSYIFGSHTTTSHFLGLRKLLKFTNDMLCKF